jgi:GntR family transcriptional regulator, transcriptional repressor for pyruvate dehydrogenase complex
MPKGKKEEPEAHRATQVVNHIRKLIEDQTLQPGDKIPPERDFAKMLGISRASLRTGIGHLAAMGVMTVRHGVGTFVTDGPAELGKSSFSLMGALHGFQRWQMFEARLILESNLAALAAERGREEHYSAMAEEVTEMYAAVDKPGEYLVHDVLFHRAIAQASGNPILAALMETITSAMYDSRRKTVERANDLKESAEFHRQIYRAVRARKPDKAREVMEAHLRLAQTAQDREGEPVKESEPAAQKAKPRARRLRNPPQA